MQLQGNQCTKGYGIREDIPDQQCFRLPEPGWYLFLSKYSVFLYALIGGLRLAMCNILKSLHHTNGLISGHLRLDHHHDPLYDPIALGGVGWGAHGIPGIPPAAGVVESALWQ